VHHLTTGEAARRCGVGINTIKRWIRRGQLEAVVTPGGHWRIPPAAFAAFLRRHRLAEAEDVASRTYRVLVIEDEPASRALLCAALEGAPLDLAVESAADGYQGLVKIGLIRPHLVVLDIVMPGLNGLEVIERLRATPELLRGLRIVVVTGATDRPLIMRRLERCGCDAVFPKPVDLERLVATVARLLGPDGWTKAPHKAYS